VYEEVKGRPLFIVAETVGDLTTPVLEKPPAGAKGTEK
jgi:hypothetical protein